MPARLAAGTFYGRKLRGRQVDGFRLSEWEYAQGATAPRHSHEHTYLNLVLQGGHVETLAHTEVSCPPQLLVLHPAGEVHGGAIARDDTRIFDIEIAPERMARLRDAGVRLDRRREFAGGSLVSLAGRIHRELVRGDALSALSIEGLALELLAEIGRAADAAVPDAAPRWLGGVRDQLHDRFAESLSLDEIAAQAGVHPDHLVHAFRRRFGCTVGDYVRRLRIDYARRRLAESDAPLAQIAVEAGFSDQSHFTRTFKRATGATPGAFRRRGGVPEERDPVQEATRAASVHSGAWDT